MKEKLLLKLNLIQFAVFNIEISKDKFIEYLNELIGNEEEIKIFSKPRFPYYGEYNYTKFEISENQRPFQNTSDAKIKGKIISHNNGIKLDIQSYLFKEREVVFLIVGIFMFLLGLLNLISTGNIQTESVFIPLLIGLFFPVFTFFYIKKVSKLGIKNFNKRIKELEKRHQKRAEIPTL